VDLLCANEERPRRTIDDQETAREAIQEAGITPFVLYALRHTCLTRWAAHMDPYTLAFLAGHADFSTTKRYVHPQQETALAAMERARKARGGTRIGQSEQKAACVEVASKHDN